MRLLAEIVGWLVIVPGAAAGLLFVLVLLQDYLWGRWEKARDMRGLHFEAIDLYLDKKNRGNPNWTPRSSCWRCEQAAEAEEGGDA